MFYAYIYRDPSRGSEPIYVGKGHGRRARQHLSRSDRHPFIQRLQKMKREGVEPTIEIIDAIDEDHAYFLEECLVSIIGRKDLGQGPLLNITEGGRGSKKGRVLTAESRQRISDIQKGRKLSAEHKAKIGLGMIGKPQSIEKSRKISEAKKGLVKSETHCKAIGDALRGKPWSEARRAAQRRKS